MCEVKAVGGGKWLDLEGEENLWKLNRAPCNGLAPMASASVKTAIAVKTPALPKAANRERELLEGENRRGGERA